MTSEPLSTPVESTPPPRARRRWPWILLAVLLLLAGLMFAGWRVALDRLQKQVLEALGPEAELRELSVAWPGILVIEDLRLKAPKDWPAQETLRADRVEVVPTLRSLITERAIVNEINIEGAYLSVLRTRQGKLVILPTLIDRARAKRAEASNDEQSGPRALTLFLIDLKGAVVDYYDATVREPKPVNLRLVDVAATFEDLKLPELDARSALKLEGRVIGEPPPRDEAGKNKPPRDADAENARKGSKKDGTLQVVGWMQVASRESELKIVLENVDLVPLEPYLIKKSETGVKRGRLSLDLTSKVRERRLHAPGRLTLEDLELDSGGGFRGTFMGMPRSAVIAALKRGGDKIELDFTLEGDLDNTQFSLNETLATRIAFGTAQALGVGFVDIIKNVGTFGGDALEATGSAIGKLFGKDDDESE
ncbi:MAG: hypothetical protein K0Q76_1475 [Panacagrimonas sp.]|nr:DUF748 domain-containing protein [Panacagrimonas sp.]MCC2656367.1 hypothetical protein [Panacagrimonas sp.]